MLYIRRSRVATDRADALAAVEVSVGWCSRTSYVPGAQVGERVFAVGVGERRGEDIAAAVQQVDPHAFEQDVRIVEVAVGTIVGDDAAR